MSGLPPPPIGGTPTTPLAQGGVTSPPPRFSATPTAQTPAQPFKPTKPIMGDILQIDTAKFITWTGGKPNCGWTDLESKSKTTSPKTPNQRRNQFSPETGYNFRQSGLETKFNRTDDLVTFENAIWAKLKDCGLDTIAYVADPVDAARMTNIVKEHTRFTLESVKTKIAPQLQLYDSYDTTNDSTASKMLLASLATEFHETIFQLIDDSTPFPVVWMEVVHAKRSVSIERYDQLALQIKQQHPSMYAAENMEKMCQVYRKLAQELSTAGQYDHNLTLRMVKTALLAGGKDNEDYRYDLRALKKRLTTELLAIGYMKLEEKEKHMARQKLSFLDVCSEITNCYRHAKDNSNWPPATNAPDSKAPPASFGNLSAGTVQLVGPDGNKFAMILQPSAGSSTPGGRSGRGPKETDTCNHCGQTGHWARDCPKKSNQQNSSNGFNRSGSRGTSHPGQTKSWKTTFSGEKVNRNGRAFEWCKQCGRYTTTHNTQTHTKKADGPAPAANYTMVQDPSAWLCSADPFGYPSDSFLSIFPRRFPSPCSLVVALAVGCCLGAFADQALLKIFEVFENASPVVWIAPFLWLLALVSVWFLPGTFQVPAPQVPPRWERRRTKPRRRSGRFRPSIRSCGLHRRYPLHLRANSHFVGSNAPTHSQRRDQQRFQDLQRTVTQLTSEVWRLRHPGSTPRNLSFSSPNPGREGGWQPRSAHPRRNRASHRRGHANRGRSSAQGGYRPVLAHGFHNFGNINLTRRQKLALAHFGTCVELERISFGFVSTDLPATNLLRAVLLAPIKFRSLTTNSFPVIWDSGASHCISFSPQDFCGSIRSAPNKTQLQGISKGLPIAGIGTVCWAFSTTDGNVRVLKLPAYYVPKAKVRLLSEHTLLQTYQGESILALANKRGLSGMGGDPSRGRIEAQVDGRTNLPVSTGYLKEGLEQGVHALNSTLSTVSKANMNLKESEKELLRWHYRLGHLSFRKVQFLMRTGVLAHSEHTRRLHAAASRISPMPKCAACQFGKQVRRSPPGSTSTKVKDEADVLRAGNLLPGQKVSADHFVCSTKGRLFESRGKTKDDDMYSGGCIFVDHSSGYAHVEFQCHLNSHETLKAKTNFENTCRDFGVIPQEYLTDNGSAFSSQEFAKKLSIFKQVLHFAGVGAHHHNSVAERGIRTIMSIARTMMLHSSIHWPDVADPCLWPMAVSHAVFLHNHVPDPSSGLSPSDVFTKTHWPQKRFHDLHVFQSPVYVLDKTIQDGKKIPRWKPRSARFQFMGFSGNHATSAPLVLNPATGAITPQFHVVF